MKNRYAKKFLRDRGYNTKLERKYLESQNRNYICLDKCFDDNKAFQDVKGTRQNYKNLYLQNSLKRNKMTKH